MFEKMTWKRQIVTQVQLALAALFVLLPVIWLLRLALDGSINDNAGVARPSDAGLLPRQWSLSNLERAWTNPLPATPFIRLLTNSLIVAGSTTLLALFFGVTAAYAFARYRFPGRKIGLFATLVLITLPPAGLSAPFFIFLNDLKIRDSLFSLIVVYSTIAIPFAIWTVRNAIQGVPRELEESAMLEGAARLAVFRLITLPLITPAIAVAGFIAFTLAWSEFALAWVFISGADRLTLAMALYAMRGQTGVSWGTLSALSVLVALPVVVLFYALGRYVISGLSLGIATSEE
ncbi:MAG TPA: carbohydrate ABC transporter permease [Chloroflexia bacterium]|nr:carbohydrate ABC transporter permease [Chloroflexia bacterium]